MKIKELADKTLFQRNTGRSDIMCKAIEEMRNEAEKLRTYQIALNLIAMNINR